MSKIILALCLLTLITCSCVVNNTKYKHIRNTKWALVKLLSNDSEIIYKGEKPIVFEFKHKHYFTDTLNNLCYEGELKVSSSDSIFYVNIKAYYQINNNSKVYLNWTNTGKGSGLNSTEFRRAFKEILNGFGNIDLEDKNMMKIFIKSGAENYKLYLKRL